MLKMIGLVPAASEVILRPPESVFGDRRLCFEAVVLLEVHNMDIQLCCFLAGIYVCVHLFGCQNKSTRFQKFKSTKLMFSMRVRSK